MELKQGDRVHVTKFDFDDVDFYATLNERNVSAVSFSLYDCTDTKYEGAFVLRPGIYDFGNEDYYTLATDEEDELPAIQHDKLVKDIEKLRKENNTLKSENKALRLQADEYFKLWQEQEIKYNKLTEHIRLKALHNPSIHRYIELKNFIKELEER